MRLSSVFVKSRLKCTPAARAPSKTGLRLVLITRPVTPARAPDTDGDATDDDDDDVDRGDRQ